MSMTKGLTKRVILALITVFILSGCFLVSDNEILKTGQKLSIESGEYLVETLNPEETKQPGLGTEKPSLGTKIKKPTIKTMKVVKSGGIFSRSYEYHLRSYELKWDHLRSYLLASR